MKNLLLIVCLFFVPGCAMFGMAEPEAQWQEVEVKGMDFDDVWLVSRRALSQTNFVVAEERLGEGKMISAWKDNLSPYSRQESRERATVSLEKKGEHHYRVRVRVESQKNTEMAKTLEVQLEDWKPTDDDVDIARFIVRQIALRTREFTPSEDFYRRQPWKKNDE